MGREHWTDVFHESDGESAGGTGLGKAKGDKVGVKELVRSLNTIYRSAEGEIGWDDPNNCPLDAKLIRQARQVELAYFRRQGVYTKVARSEALRSRAKVIQLRCVDANNGDPAPLG